jgi:hypothetical protein
MPSCAKILASLFQTETLDTDLLPRNLVRGLLNQTNVQLIYEAVLRTKTNGLVRGLLNQETSPHLTAQLIYVQYVALCCGPRRRLLSPFANTAKH